jgi:hypothetical protein
VAVLSSTGNAGWGSRHRWTRASRLPREVMAVQGLGPEVAASEAAEIELMLTKAGDTAELAARLSWRLRLLVRRAVPPRAVEPAPVPRAARLRFADGTTVVVKGAVPGDLGVLAMAMQHWSVKPTACSIKADGAELAVIWPGAHHLLFLQVVGLDQPD